MIRIQFETDPGVEIARILREIAEKIEAGHDCPQCGQNPCSLSGVVLDVNGNSIGTVEYIQ